MHAGENEIAQRIMPTLMFVGEVCGKAEEAISFMVGSDAQEEIDHYWDSLSAVPEAEQCGWCKDRFGLSWQVMPSAMDAMLRGGTEEQIARVTEAFLAMKKFDLAVFQRAYE